MVSGGFGALDRHEGAVRSVAWLPDGNRSCPGAMVAWCGRGTLEYTGQPSNGDLTGHEGT